MARTGNTFLRVSYLRSDVTVVGSVLIAGLVVLLGTNSNPQTGQSAPCLCLPSDRACLFQRLARENELKETDKISNHLERSEIHHPSICLSVFSACLQFLFLIASPVCLSVAGSARERRRMREHRRDVVRGEQSIRGDER